MNCQDINELPFFSTEKKGWPWEQNISLERTLLDNKEKFPKISIITPSYNQGEFIEETLLSVIFQGYPNLEYIVIDGGSADESVEIIKKYEPWISYWISEPDNGQTHAINKGLEKATGDIIAYLNSDDLYQPETFQIVVDFFNDNPDVDMVFGDIVHIDRDSNILSKISREPINIEQFYGCCFYIPQPTVFLRKNIVVKIGAFDETLNLGMDLDYWMRLSFQGKIVYLSEILASARIYPEAKSSDLSVNYLEEHLKILDKNKKNIVKIHNSDDLLRNSYSSVYFSGGLKYLKCGNFVYGLKQIINSMNYNFRKPFCLSFPYSIICGLFGEKLIKMVIGPLIEIWK